MWIPKILDTLCDTNYVHAFFQYLEEGPGTKQIPMEMNNGRNDSPQLKNTWKG